jgi:hypothetical protein
VYQFRSTRTNALVAWVWVFAVALAVAMNVLGEPFSTMSLRHSSRGALGR